MNAQKKAAIVKPTKVIPHAVPTAPAVPPGLGLEKVRQSRERMHSSSSGQLELSVYPQKYGRTAKTARVTFALGVGRD